MTPIELYEMIGKSMKNKILQKYSNGIT